MNKRQSIVQKFSTFLSFLGARNGHKCLLWIGNKYQKTYDKQIWSMLTVHPHLKVYATELHGRFYVGVAIQSIREFRPQAGFRVSNKAATKAVVNSCLAKGIPACRVT